MLPWAARFAPQCRFSRLVLLPSSLPASSRYVLPICKYPVYLHAHLCCALCRSGSHLFYLYCFHPSESRFPAAGRGWLSSNSLCVSLSGSLASIVPIMYPETKDFSSSGSIVNTCIISRYIAFLCSSVMATPLTQSSLYYYAIIIYYLAIIVNGFFTFNFTPQR